MREWVENYELKMDQYVAVMRKREWKRKKGRLKWRTRGKRRRRGRGRDKGGGGSGGGDIWKEHQGISKSLLICRAGLKIEKTGESLRARSQERSREGQGIWQKEGDKVRST